VEQTPPECPRCGLKGKVVQEHVISGSTEILVWICERCRRLLWKVSKRRAVQ
jgi:hypothetical protein